VNLAQPGVAGWTNQFQRGSQVGGILRLHGLAHGLVMPLPAPVVVVAQMRRLTARAPVHRDDRDRDPTRDRGRVRMGEPDPPDILCGDQRRQHAAVYHSGALVVVARQNSYQVGDIVAYRYGPGDLMARLGEDEFAVMREDVTRRDGRRPPSR